MIKKIKSLLTTFILTLVLVLPFFVFAADPLKLLEETGAKEGPYSTANQFTFAAILGTVVKAALGLLGIIFVILLVYAGYTYMTARGEEEKVKKALGTIKTAIIGIIIVLVSYASWTFISKALGIY